MNFTTKEKKILDFYIAECRDLKNWLKDQASGVCCYSDFRGLGMDDKTLKGVVGSLVKKGILIPEDDFTVDPLFKTEQVLWLNPEYVESILRKEK